MSAILTQEGQVFLEKQVSQQDFVLIADGTGRRSLRVVTHVELGKDAIRKTLIPGLYFKMKRKIRCNYSNYFHL